MASAGLHNPTVFTRQNSSSAVSLDFEPNNEYTFVEKLQERYKCAYCHSVLHNPHQTGCGHRFCQKCVASLREINESPTCPLDNEIIKPHEVFKDNCCKREVLNLHVFCKNIPDCGAKVTLGRYQDHLKQCLCEITKCPNDGCHEKILRKDVTGHLEYHCKFREETCPHCKQSMMAVNLKNHVQSYCPDYPVSCPNKCSKVFPRAEGDEHLSVCIEAEIECPFKSYGCLVKDKRGKVREHEDTYLRTHMLLVLERNTRLEVQISDLYRNMEVKEQKIQQLVDTVTKCEMEYRQFNQFFSTNGNLATSTKTLANHIEKAAWLETQVKQLEQLVNQEQNRLDLRPVLETIEDIKGKIAFMETYEHRLAALETLSEKHSDHLSVHKAQLSSNEERFKVLEGTCYNGKLIWKILEYKKKKREASEGRIPSIFSQPFYTSRCGYRLCARAYLNGDGSGKGEYMSLYFVVMRGEFDSLLQWPFRQKVTLILLDQSGKRNHIVNVFKASPNSSSFKRPEGEMNIASGFPRFVSHVVLENATNSYIKEDALFIKIIVDLTDLEEV
ncbi:TNF receptor-associated factor 5 [Ambystoma mexicanum]|uniref:TNF receptor-associated factor 5 n=1 Tax=Ambystoma mexicanum TaxID=8296 RepID=UPI0037E7F036